MELEKAIKNVKKFNEQRFRDCGVLNQSIDTVLEELNNRIPRKDIEDKLNEFVEKSLLDIAETEKFKFEYTLDGLYAIKHGVIHVLKELLIKE